MKLDASNVEVYRQPLIDGRYEAGGDYSLPDSLRSLALPDAELAIAPMLGI